MVFDVLRGYLNVASGLTDVTKQRARDLAELIVVQGMDVTTKSQEQVQTLSDELVESSRTNKELLIGLVRTEVDRTVSRMGFVREDELAAVRQHVHRLETQLQKEHHRAADKAAEVVMGTAGSSTSAARSAVGAASKTVSGVAGVMASGAAKVAGSATSGANPAGDGSVGPKATAPSPETSDSAAGESAATPSAGSDKSTNDAEDIEPVLLFDEADALFGKRAEAKKPTPRKKPAKKAPAKKKPARKKATTKKAAPKKRATAKKATTKRAGDAGQARKSATKKPKSTGAQDQDLAAAQSSTPKESSTTSGKKKT